MTKPTPRPWKILEITDEDDNAMFLQIVAGGSVGICNTANCDFNDETELANARHIVHCVNLHEEMLGALIQATRQLQADYVVTPLDGHGALIRKLQATIAKAEGAL